jgi:Lrp/AsnC family transcriptional regulator, leucine-responsive regulatory protein
VDDIDSRILDHLQVNGRLTMTELGKLVNLTTPAVTERVRKLEERGVIEAYRAIVNPRKLGQGIVAFIHVSTANGRNSSFAEFAKSKPEIIECHRVTGESCYSVKVVVPDTEALEELIDSIMVYGKTRTAIVLSCPVDFKPVPRNLVVL